MEVRKIGIDPGFGGFKVAEIVNGEANVKVIPSVVGIGETDIGMLSAGLGRNRSKIKPLAIGFGKVSYLVGPDVHLYARPTERLDFLRLSEGPELRALIYSALWQIINGGSHDVSLLVGLPVEIMKDTGHARATLQGLRGWLLGNHNFTVNGDEVKVRVHQIKAIAQPVGTYFFWGTDEQANWTQGLEALRAPVAISDIGFNTLDNYSIERGQVVGRFTGGDTLGMRRAAEILKNNIKNQFGVETSLHEADDFIKGNRTTLYYADGTANLKDLVKQALDSVATEITSFIERAWGNGRQFRHLLITGGGASALSERILRQYPHGIVMPDPVTANAIGLSKYATKQGVF